METFTVLDTITQVYTVSWHLYPGIICTGMRIKMEMDIVFKHNLHKVKTNLEVAFHRLKALGYPDLPVYWQVYSKILCKFFFPLHFTVESCR